MTARRSFIKLIAGALVASAIELRLCDLPEVVGDAAWRKSQMEAVMQRLREVVESAWEQRMREQFAASYFSISSISPSS